MNGHSWDRLNGLDKQNGHAGGKMNGTCGEKVNGYADKVNGHGAKTNGSHCTNGHAAGSKANDTSPLNGVLDKDLEHFNKDHGIDLEPPKIPKKVALKI